MLLFPPQHTVAVALTTRAAANIASGKILMLPGVPAGTALIMLHGGEKNHLI